MQRYVEQLRRCLQSEASEQPLANAAVGVVKLATEIVSLLSHPSLPAWCVYPHLSPLLPFPCSSGKVLVIIAEQPLTSLHVRIWNGPIGI